MLQNIDYILHCTSLVSHDINLVSIQMSMWTAGIVVMTLLVNAPLIPLLLKWTGLSQVSPVKAKIRAKAARAFTRYTQNAVKELKNDEDEMLRGESPETQVFFHPERCNGTQD